jgi:PPM family protein phosphatase
MLEDDAMAGILAQTGADLDEACRQLVERANANGGTDNVTVVLAAPASARP